MDPTEVFSSKAQKYARYRWDYAPQAIQTLFSVTQVSRESVVADIGAGTGILTAPAACQCRTARQSYTWGASGTVLSDENQAARTPCAPVTGRGGQRS
jgi:predicted RNA methylase